MPKPKYGNAKKAKAVGRKRGAKPPLLTNKNQRKMLEGLGMGPEPYKPKARKTPPKTGR